jgi:enoyl-CoA hydratase/carnithine racemase
MVYHHLALEYEPGYAVITLDRPKANALSRELLQEIRGSVEDAGANPDVRCILLTSANERFFSAGADLPSLNGNLSDVLAPDSLSEAGLRAVEAIETSATPVVAVINGIAVGGGSEISLACHFRIACQSAHIGQPEVNIGIIPGWGGTHRLIRLIGYGRALDWVVTGRMVPAPEAYQAGYLNRLIADDSLMEEARAFAAAIAKQPPLAVATAMRVMREQTLQPENGLELEAAGFVEVAATQDATEGVAAFLEKRSAKFTGQ